MSLVHVTIDLNESLDSGQFMDRGPDFACKTSTVQLACCQLGQQMVKAVVQFCVRCNVQNTWKVVESFLLFSSRSSHYFNRAHSLASRLPVCHSPQIIPTLKRLVKCLVSRWMLGFEAAARLAVVHLLATQRNRQMN